MATLLRRRTVLLGLTALLAGCYAHGRVWGSGVTAHQQRTVAPFERIHAMGSMDVETLVGHERAVMVWADDNLINDVITEVDGDTLEIKMESGSYHFSRPLKVRVCTPKLREITMSGSGDARVRNMKGSSLRLSIRGSGDIHAEGKVGRLKATISGSGDMRLGELRARTAEVKIAGSGDMHLWVTDELEGSVAGSGDVRVHGTPAVTSWRSSGSGDLRVRE